MKKLISLAMITAVTVALAAVAQAQPLTLSGAGATFPYPLYSQWAQSTVLALIWAIPPPEPMD